MVKFLVLFEVGSRSSFPSSAWERETRRNISPIRVEVSLWVAPGRGGIIATRRPETHAFSEDSHRVTHPPLRLPGHLSESACRPRGRAKAAPRRHHRPGHLARR